MLPIQAGALHVPLSQAACYVSSDGALVAWISYDPALIRSRAAGQEVEWLPHVTQILSDQLKEIDFRGSSDFSHAVAAAVQHGEIDLGFSRLEPQPDVTYAVIASEPIVAILAGDHPLAAQSEIDPADLGRFPFIGYTDTPHVLRDIVARYLREQGVTVSTSHFLDSFATGISLVASTGGMRLLPAYVEKLLPRTVVSRPLAGPRTGDRDCCRISGGQSFASVA